MVLHGHTAARRKKLLGRTAGRLGSLSTKLTGKARAASVNKGKQGLRRRSSRALGREGRRQAGLPIGIQRPGLLRPASGTVDRTRAKQRRLRQIKVTRTR